MPTAEQVAQRITDALDEVRPSIPLEYLGLDLDDVKRTVLTVLLRELPGLERPPGPG